MIRERGPGRWEVVVYVGKADDGKERRISRSLRGTKADAVRLERRLHIEHGDERRVPGITLGDLLDQWLSMVEGDLSPSTLHAYKGYIRREIRPELGDVSISTLSAARLDRFYAGLRGRLAPATIRQVHAVISRALGQAVKWSWVEYNAASRATPPRIPRHEIAPPSLEDVRRLLDAAATDDINFATFLWLAATTGARRGELCALRWADVDLETGSLLIGSALIEVGGTVTRKDTKTHAARRVALDEATLAVLETHRARAVARASECGGALTADAPVFVADMAGTPLSPNAATARYRRLAKRLGITTRLHDLRHWHVTQLLSGGTSVRDAAARVGHASAVMTLTTYGHAVPAADRTAAERVGRLLEP